MPESFTPPQNCDLLIHLGGEQVAPLCLGASQIVAERHLVVTSKKASFVRNGLKSFLGNQSRVDLLEVNPFDAPAVTDALRKRLSGETSRSIILNATGGPKPMFIGAVAALPNVPMFYIETQPNKQIVWMHKGDFSAWQLVPAFESVEDFVIARGDKVLEPGQWSPRQEARRNVTMRLWERRFVIGQAQSAIVQKKLKDGQPFTHRDNRWTVSLDKAGVGSVIFPASQHATEETFNLPDAPDLARYVTGGWFEEFCYLQLEPLVTRREIRDLRINVKPAPAADVDAKAMQEFDLAFTDGFCLTIVECKAGAVSQDHVQKLENLTAQYGGSFGRGILASTFRPYGNSETRIQRSRTICGFFNNGIRRLTRNAITAAPGSMAS